MSKSLGNFVTIDELLNTEKFGGRNWPGEVLRLAMLRTHYRQPIDWTVKALEEAEKTLDKWYETIDDVDSNSQIAPDFLDAMADDLNFSAAESKLHALAHPAMVGSSPPAETLKSTANLCGLLTMTNTQWRALRSAEFAVDAAHINSLIAARLEARKAKNWTESDRIRDELAALGVVLKDNKDGTTTWEIKR